MSYHACLGNWGEVGVGGVVTKTKKNQKKTPHKKNHHKTNQPKTKHPTPPQPPNKP